MTSPKQVLRNTYLTSTRSLFFNFSEFFFLSNSANTFLVIKNFHSYSMTVVKALKYIDFCTIESNPEYSVKNCRTLAAVNFMMR